jgi:hypothetical protein
MVLSLAHSQRIGLLLIVVALALCALLPAIGVRHDYPQEAALDKSRPADGHSNKVTFAESSCDEIRKGMTLQQVEEILGMPPGDYTSAEYLFDLPNVTARDLQRQSWKSDAGEIIVWFDENNRVDDAAFRQLHFVHLGTQSVKWQLFAPALIVGFIGLLLVCRRVAGER